MVKRLTLAAILALSTVALAEGGKTGSSPKGPRMEPDDLPGPRPEVARDPAKIEVPAVPAFDLPAVEPGFHGPRELHVHGKPALDTEIQVKGYVTWIYDCPAALAAGNPRATRAQILQSIQRDPSLCERPKLALGDARDTPREASISVVEVPRPPTRAERRRLPPGELEAWPAVPKIAVGDYVVVTGTWALSSPHGERNAAGLLVYKALDRAAPPAGPPTAAPASPSEPEIAVVTRPPLRKAVPDAVRNASVDHMNACNKAIAARQYDAGIAACQAAVKTWDGNHLAWYAWASAHMAKGEWPKAVEAVEHAVTLRPDHGMYQLYHGISLYEAEHARVRDEQARQDHKSPEEVTIDASRLRLDGAQGALRRAVKLAPELWRAHYYLGRVYRDLGDDRRAAEQFRATIATHPSYRFGYLALIELYRRWDYFDHALAIAQLGTAHVPAAEAGELWLEAATIHEARRDEAGAIEALGKAIAGDPNDLTPKFRRGQIYFRRGDFANARRDLAEVVTSSDPRIADTRPVAVQMLSQMLSKPANKRR